MSELLVKKLMSLSLKLVGPGLPAIFDGPPPPTSKYHPMPMEWNVALRVSSFIQF